MNLTAEITISIVRRTDAWSGESERVLEVRLVDANGDTVSKDNITATEMRDWLGLGHPQ